MTTTKSYDYIDRLLSISSTAGSANISSHAYTCNDANQRTRAQLGDGSYWIYEYDKLGQVISGKRYWADGTLVPGQQHEYAFDDIGNRTTAKTGGDTSGQNLRSSSYTANNLNQYSSRTVPGYLQAMGISHPTATVTVSGQSAWRKGEFYQSELSVLNTSAAQYPSITNRAVLSGTTNTSIGSLFLAQTAESLSYDSDGNVTGDGRWVNTWDGENRLVTMESLSSNPTASKRKVEYTYDHQSRLIRRKSYNGAGGSYVVSTDTKWIYDGWRQLAELNATNNALVRGLTWGLDLGGSLEKAGGIGGLLMFTDGGTSTTHFYAYDGNGNVMALVKATDGTKSANYEYGPFGEVIRISGSAAKANPFRFSTKCQDEETELVYYGYRFYNSAIGRWVSRDPIGEHSFASIYSEGKSRVEREAIQQAMLGHPYSFVNNQPPQWVDKHGLDRWHGDQLHTYVIVEVWDEDGINVVGYKRIEFHADYCKCRTWLTLFLYAPGVIQILDWPGPPEWSISWKIPSSPAADKFLLQWAEELQRDGPDYYNFIGANCRNFSAYAQNVGIEETNPATPSPLPPPTPPRWPPIVPPSVPYFPPW